MFIRTTFFHNLSHFIYNIVFFSFVSAHCMAQKSVVSKDVYFIPARLFLYGIQETQFNRQFADISRQYNFGIMRRANAGRISFFVCHVGYKTIYIQPLLYCDYSIMVLLDICSTALYHRLFCLYPSSMFPSHFFNDNIQCTHKLNRITRICFDYNRFFACSFYIILGFLARLLDFSADPYSSSL